MSQDRGISSGSVQPNLESTAAPSPTAQIIDLNARRTRGARASRTTPLAPSPSSLSLSSHLHSPGADPQSDSANQVLDMVERREAILNAERRELKRTILTEFVGAFVLVPNSGLVRSAIYDISENGIAFDLDLGTGSFNVGDQVAMRVYLNQFTFFPFVVTVANARSIPDESVVRHGCHFVKDTINHEALRHFVKFIETVSASLRTDHGDVMTSQRV